MTRGRAKLTLLLQAFVSLSAVAEGSSPIPTSEHMGAANGSAPIVEFHWPVDGAAISCSVPCGECHFTAISLTFNTSTVATLRITLDGVDTDSEILAGGKYDRPRGHNVMSIGLDDVDFGQHTLEGRVVEIESGKVWEGLGRVTFDLVPVHTSEAHRRRRFVSFVPRHVTREHRMLGATAAAHGGFDDVSLINYGDIHGIVEVSSSMCPTQGGGLDDAAMEAWRAASCLAAMSKMADGDTLFYADTGYEFVSSTASLLHATGSQAKNGVLVFQDGLTERVRRDVVAMVVGDAARTFVETWSRVATDPDALTQLFESQSVAPDPVGGPLRRRQLAPEEEAYLVWSPYCFMDMPLPRGG